ncbi:MAG TPA: protein-glutamate O-methyltransferase CheR, partial [Verrucomicrobiae bacterium]|nr:protein-glutamate O-methyltransferase CheR [Verrucomicrobiae bacterium]
MNPIESLLRKEIGLDAASIGSSAIERTVRLRMKNLGLKNSNDYARLLDASRAELDELVEAVVVTETWFFRDRDPFNAFLGLALEWLGQHPAGRLRVLSVPCSSGEEPYSLAIALLDAQILPHRFVINAVDISTHAVARAKQAVYGKNSFRGKELAFRDRHFLQTKDGYALNRHVRECVQFFRDNLLGDAFLLGHMLYDFIFCRNLLIYFDRATQVRALEKLHRLLAPQGVLFVGPAETPLVADNGFVNANLAMAFACRKVATKTDPESGNAGTAAAGILPVVVDGRLPPEKAPGFSTARLLPAPGRVPGST